jgi:hypothetical protein
VGGEGDTGHDARDVLVVFDVKIDDFLPVYNADADRHLFGVLGALVGRDDHLLQRTLIRGTRPARLGACYRASERQGGQQARQRERGTLVYDEG